MAEIKKINEKEKPTTEGIVNKPSKEQIQQTLVILNRQRQTYIYALDNAVKNNDNEIIEFASTALSTTIKHINFYTIQLNSCETEEK